MGKELYKLAKQAKVGESIQCAHCGKVITKTQWAQAFCCPACKDSFWNKKGDRHKNKRYYHDYNLSHPERLERIGIDIEQVVERDEEFDFCDW